MITAATITDDQIRELQRETGLEVCAIALGHNPYPHPRSTMLALRMQLDARARCAEILNERAEEMPRMSCGCPIDAHSDSVNVGLGPGTGATCGRGWPIDVRKEG